MARYINEMLADLDKSTIAKYKDQAGALKIIFEYAYDPAKLWILPAGDPPFKAAVEPLGMTPTNLYTELRRFYVFCRTDLKKQQREQLFINLLEGIHPTEATLILAIKDQNLTKLYPKLTHKFAFENGFLALDPTEKKAKKSKTPAGGVKV